MKLSFQALSAASLAALLSVASAENLRSESASKEDAAVVPEEEVTLPPNGCYTNMDDIYEALKDDSKVHEKKRFVVCPNTTMDIGFLVPGVGIDKGQAPIIPRANTEFLCGEDGKSSNNCVLQGGDFGVIMVPVFFRQDGFVNNVRVAGFTFRDQKQYGVFAATEGGISIEDCIFEDAANFGAMVFNYDSTLELGPFNENEDMSTKKMDVSIKDCVFQNLQQIEHKLGVENGIVSIKGKDHRVTMENNLFYHNHFGDAEISNVGYGIWAQEGDIDLEHNCFIDNEFRGNGPVLIDEAHASLFDNFVTEQGDGAVDCSFAALIASKEQVVEDEKRYSAAHSPERLEMYACVNDSDTAMAKTCGIHSHGIKVASEAAYEKIML